MKKKPVNIIVAYSQNRAIGLDNKLLWHLPADMRHFKALTTSHIVVMGRKTYDSIGRPLPNRLNIVISRQADLKIEGCMVASSLEDALQKANQAKDTYIDKEIFIIGGEQIYKQALSHASKIYATEVEVSLHADAFFPILNSTEWQKAAEQNHTKDEKHLYNYRFVEYLKVNKN